MKRRALWTRAFPEQVRVGPRETKRVKDRLYQRLKTDYLKKHRNCRVALLIPGPGNGVLVPATQVHHIRGRRGTLLIDKRFWCPVSAPWHEWIHRNPEAARGFGFLCAVGEFDRPPRDAESERLRDLIRKETCQVMTDARSKKRSKRS